MDLNTAGFNFPSPQHEKQWDFVSKFDFNLRDNSLVYVRYAQGSQSTFGDSVNGGRPIFPDTPNFVDTARTPKNLAVNWRWSPTPTLTNEAIFGLSKFFFSFATPFPDPNLPFAFLNPATPNTNFYLQRARSADAPVHRQRDPDSRIAHSQRWNQFPFQSTSRRSFERGRFSDRTSGDFQ